MLNWKILSVLALVSGMSSVGFLNLMLHSSASAQEDEGEPIPEEVPEDQAEKAREFWTPERMMEAKPFPVGDAGSPPPDSEAETPDLEPKRRSGSPPTDDNFSLPRENLPSPTDNFSSPPENLPSPDRFNGPFNKQISTQLSEKLLASQTLQNNYTRYPFSTMGKVFFTKDESLYSCSGAVINTEGKSLVWTAGHCVAGQGNGNWHRNWIFVPAYQNGKAPFGKWSARVLWTWSGWISNGNRNYDLGAVKVREKRGKRLGNVVGTLGWMFNFPRNLEYTEFGYPSAGSRFNGQLLVQCQAPYSGTDGVRAPGPRTSTNKCDFTAGASGGPWVTEFEDCPNCFINSVNSWWWWGETRDKALQWAGPYHGNAAYRLYKAAGR
jgi:V8-like Glu-specific endopeptidase